MTAEPPLRPEPPRRWADTLQAWLAWLGPARLVVTASSVVVVAGGVAWLVRAPAATTEARLPFGTVSTVVDVGGSDTAVATLPVPEPPASTVPPVGPLVVHVAGAVARPGVYEMAPDARVHTVIEGAGGASDVADLDGLNLAATVADGQRIYVPVIGEVDPATVPSGPTPTDPVGDGAAAGEPIDLNSASAAELETLPGIGPATAAAIVDDRDRHGPFAAVSDLERVPGIGPAKLAAIADRATV